MTHPLLTKLGLPPQISRACDLPEGIDGAAILAALTAALVELAPILDMNVAAEPVPGHVLRIVATAAKSLLADPSRLREAVYLTEQARADQTDSASLAHIRILALAQMGARAKLIAEIDRLLAQEPPDARLQEILHGFVRNRKMTGAIAQRAQNHGWLWGDIPQDLGQQVRLLQPSEKSIALAPKQIDFLYGLRNEGGLARADFSRRLLWGVAALQYIKFINHSTVGIRNNQPLGRPMSAEEVGVLALFNQIETVVLSPDLHPLEQARSEGRSIVIVDAHAGKTLVSNLGLMRLGLPITIVSAMTRQSIDPRNLNINTSGKDVQTTFLKLVKLIKNQQRLVRLSPDGGAGDVREFDLFGRTIKLGQGAAMLAYHGRAATFFASSRWDGVHFQLSFKPGPVAMESQPREDFDREFYEFYLGHLRQIVSGAPEDMGINGGFWRFLL